MSDLADNPVRVRPVSPDNALFDTSSVDFSARAMSKDQIHAWIPHRGAMSLLDGMVWMSEDLSQVIGVKKCLPDEFWVPGHFPDVPLFPGVLMVEASAQLMCTQYNMKVKNDRIGVFTRILNCAFRQSVTVGDELYLLVQETKFGSRRFQGLVQGWVNGKLAFDAELSGMIMIDKIADQSS